MDLYTVLGLTRDAGGADIRRAYRRLARRFHPGVNPGDREAETRFAQIALAFETLGDPERRRVYDAGGEPGAERPEVAFGFEGFDFTVNVSGEHHASTFGDLFADVLTRDLTSRPEAGADVHLTVTVTLDEVMTGVERYATLSREAACRACGGTGVRRMDPVTCPACHGAGRVRSSRGHMVFAKRCELCQGEGQQRACVCRSCGGQGVETTVERVRIPVPAGVADGAEVRLPGLGHAGRRGGRAGDLFVLVQVEPHPFYRRDGDDLHIVVPVAVHEAALGARIEVPTPEGPVRLRVPPGTQSGQRLRLRERGVAGLRSGTRGDLIVEVRLVLPPLIDERSKELLREFGRINVEDVRKDLWAGGADRREAGEKPA